MPSLEQPQPPPPQQLFEIISIKGEGEGGCYMIDLTSIICRREERKAKLIAKGENEICCIS